MPGSALWGVRAELLRIQMVTHRSIWLQLWPEPYGGVWISKEARDSRREEAVADLEEEAINWREERVLCQEEVVM